MITKIHGFAGMIALLCILTFWTSTVVVELFGSNASIAFVKRSIIWGMALLIPSIITTAVTGNLIGKNNEAKLVATKKKRMPIIALNGLFILLPSAFFLDHLALRGEFTSIFFAVQILELVAGATNFLLISSSARDGFRLSGKLAFSSNKNN